MTDTPENTNVALARIEVILTNLTTGFNDFKSSHKSDIDFLMNVKDKLEARLKILEDDLIHRRSGILSYRTVIEAIALLAGIAYYLTEMHK